jgi:serine/threonine-protein kinase
MGTSGEDERVMAQEGALVGQTLEGYKLRKLLGVGGMAEVYLADEPSLHREVAVKILPRLLATDPNYVARFRDEARHVANLSHPNIVPVYTFGESHGLLYLVMPLLKESLRDRMDREGKMEPRDVGRIAYAIASALNSAHALGIVHRDVKPENILMDAEGKPMLTDFGIAREMADLHQDGAMRTLAATGLPVGTPEYMAPEQLRGQAATPQADIYALGAVVYEMITARVPHDAATPYEVATAALRDPIVPPSRYNPAITPALEQVILTAMARTPESRYPDMKAFALDLRDALNGRASDTSNLRWTRFMPSERGGPSALPARAPDPVDVSPGASSATIKHATLSAIIEPRAPQSGHKSRRLGLDESASRSATAAARAAALAAGPTPPKTWKTRWSRPIFRIGELTVTPLILGSAAVALALLLTVFGIGAAAIGNALGGGHSSAATVQPTYTLEPTYTPQPTYTPRPTATSVGPQGLVFSPKTVTLSGDGGFCSGQVTIENLAPYKISWQWTGGSFSNGGPKNASWKLGSGGGFPTTFSSKKPSGTLSAYAGGSSADSAQLTLYASCSSGTYSGTIRDSAGHTYSLTIKIP